MAMGPEAGANPEVDTATTGATGRLLGGVGNTAMAFAFAVALGASPSLTRPAAFLVLAAAVAAWALWFSLEERRVARAATNGRVRVSVWLVIGATFASWELGAYVLGDDAAHPTFSRLADPLLSWPPARALAGLGWVIWGRQLSTLAPPVTQETTAA